MLPALPRQIPSGALQIQSMSWLARSIHWVLRCRAPVREKDIRRAPRVRQIRHVSVRVPLPRLLGHPQRPPPDSVGAHSPLDYGFARFSSTLAFIFALNHAISDDLLLADMDLGFFLSSQSRTHTRHLVVLQRALGLSPSQSQLIELGDEIFGFNPQFFGQKVDSRLTHLRLLPLSLFLIRLSVVPLLPG